jgi:hypothetical protein
MRDDDDGDLQIIYHHLAGVEFEAHHNNNNQKQKLISQIF